MHVANTLDKTPGTEEEARHKRSAAAALRVHTAARAAFGAADDAWQRELERVFGKRAGDARYRPEGKGEDGSMLRFFHDQRMRLFYAHDAAQTFYRRVLAGADADALAAEFLADDVCRCARCAA